MLLKKEKHTLIFQKIYLQPCEKILGPMADNIQPNSTSQLAWKEIAFSARVCFVPPLCNGAGYDFQDEERLLLDLCCGEDILPLSLQNRLGRAATTGHLGGCPATSWTHSQHPAKYMALHHLLKMFKFGKASCRFVFFLFLAPFFCRVSSRFWTVVLVSLQAIFAFLASPRCSTHGPSTTYVGSNFILFAGTLVFNTG